MRLIQFNSGLRIVLKDVQQHPNDHSQRYYLAAPTPAHHSSNSSIATTSSSIKSNGSSSGTTSEYYLPRGYVSTSRSTIYYSYNQVKTPPIANATPSTSTVYVEVGSKKSRWTTRKTRSTNENQSGWLTSDPFIRSLLDLPLEHLCVCVRLTRCTLRRVIFVRKIDTCDDFWPSFNDQWCW